MRSNLIVQAMLENGFLNPEHHNPNDYVNYTVRALKVLDAALQDAKKHEDVADVVATMFENGFCTQAGQADPSEWIMFAQTAIAELKVL